MQIDLTMRNFGKETLNLLGCVSGMKDEFDPINYPRYDFNYQERLKTFRGIQVRETHFVLDRSEYFSCQFHRKNLHWLVFHIVDMVIGWYVYIAMESWKIGQRGMIRWQSTFDIMNLVHSWHHLRKNQNGQNIRGIKID